MSLEEAEEEAEEEAAAEMTGTGTGDVRGPEIVVAGLALDPAIAGIAVGQETRGRGAEARNPKAGKSRGVPQKTVRALEV